MAMNTTDVPSGTAPVDEGREGDTTAGLLRRLVDDLATLVRKELALARSEMVRSVDEAKAGVGSLATGGAVLHAGLLALVAAAIVGLAEVMDTWLAALIVGVVLAAVGYGMVRAGRNKLNAASRAPAEHTRESLQRDKELFDRRAR